MEQKTEQLKRTLNWYLDISRQMMVSLEPDNAEDDNNLEFIMEVSNQDSPDPHEAIQKYLSLNSKINDEQLNHLRKFVASNLGAYKKNNSYYQAKVEYSNGNKLLYTDKNNKPIVYLAKSGDIGSAFMIEITHLNQIKSLLLGINHYEDK